MGAVLSEPAKAKFTLELMVKKVSTVQKIYTDLKGRDDVKEELLKQVMHGIPVF